MVRVRVGHSWKQNPEYQAGLQAVAEGRSRGFSPRQIVDCVQVELDGVDITGGMFEVPLVDSLIGLNRLTASLEHGFGERPLLRSSRVLTIAKSEDCETVLRIHSEGDGCPRVEFEAEIDSAHFAGEVRKAARQLHATLVELHPALANHRIVALLRHAGEAANRSNPEKRSLHPEWSRTANLNDWKLAVRKRSETLHLLDSMSQIRWSGGSAAKARKALERALAANGDGGHHIRIESETDSVFFGRSPPFPRSVVVATFQELFPEFELATSAEVPAARTLAIGAPEANRRAGAPGLPPQGLRRVAMRRAWAVESGDSDADVLALGQAVVIRTPRRVEVRSKAGQLCWSAELDAAQLVHSGGSALIVGARHSKTLEIRDALSGDLRRRAEVGFVRSPRSAHALDDGTIAVQDETRLVGVGAGQGRLWTHDFRDRYSVVSTGSGLISLSSAGVFEGLNAGGETCWRRESALRITETLQIDHAHGVAMAAGRDEAGFPLIVTVSAADGRVLVGQRLTPGWESAPVLAHGRAHVARKKKNRVCVVALDATTGRELFDVTLPVSPGVILTPEEDGHLLIGAAGGEWFRLTSAGIRTTHHTSRDPDSTLSPRQPRLLLRMDKLVVSAGTHLHFADAQTGRALASLEPGDLTLTSACALDGPMVVTTSADGVVEAWESRGHLGVVPSRFSDEEL